MSHHTKIHHIFSYVKEYARDAQIKKKKQNRTSGIEFSKIN